MRCLTGTSILALRGCVELERQLGVGLEIFRSSESFREKGVIMGLETLSRLDVLDVSYTKSSRSEADPVFITWWPFVF